MLRVRVAFLLAFLFAMAVVIRMSRIQFVEGDKWTAMAEEIGLQFRTVKATRGSIYSDNGSFLATSLPFYRVAFDPSVADDQTFNDGLDSLAYYISDYYGDRLQLITTKKRSRKHDSQTVAISQ